MTASIATLPRPFVEPSGSAVEELLLSSASASRRGESGGVPRTTGIPAYALIESRSVATVNDREVQNMRGRGAIRLLSQHGIPRERAVAMLPANSGIAIVGWSVDGGRGVPSLSR